MKKTIDTIHLETTETTTPDFGGFRFYVEAGTSFDVSAYAEAYNLNLPDIDSADIDAANDAAARLSLGEWLEVSHEIQYIDHE